MKQNRLKYAPVLKEGTLTSATPAKPVPYTHYTRERKDEKAIALSAGECVFIKWPKTIDNSIPSYIKSNRVYSLN